MKRRIAIAALVLLVTCMVLPMCFAQETFPYITDKADLLTNEQIKNLEERASEISTRYEMGVYIIALDDFQKYSNYRSISGAAMDIYDSYGLGLGEDKAGVTLMLSMAERDYNLDFYGSRADYAFTEAGRDRIEERVVSFLRYGDYYGAFSAWLDLCDSYLRAAKEGNPVGQGEPSSADWQEDSEGLGFLAVIPGIVAAALTGAVLVAPMRTAGQKTHANDYVVDGSLELTRRSDMFLHRSVTRRPRQNNNSGRPGGGGGIHYSGGGHSGRSGKF